MCEYLILFQMHEITTFSLHVNKRGVLSKKGSMLQNEQCQ